LHETIPNHPNRGRRRPLLKALALLVLIALCALAGAGWYASRLLLPTPVQDTAVRVSLPPGSGIGALAEQLERKGIIRSASAFVLYLKWKKEGGRFQAGEYEMKPGMTHAQIISQLNRGETVKKEMVRVTIPEGFTADQIAAKLAEIGVDAAAFIQAAQQPKSYTAGRASSVPADEGLRVRLEGYLFPETYEWAKDDIPAPGKIVQRMLEELDRKLESLPEGWESAMEERGLTFHELLTVASLIEREAVLEEERAVIAGVIYNRLNRDMPLQIDATVQYLFETPKERLYHKDLQMESPYNTYLHSGLPPGPIASPGLSAIRAALYPADTPYLFYVTKKDGSNGHLFAETYDQHLNNIEASNKNAARKTGQ